MTTTEYDKPRFPGHRHDAYDTTARKMKVVGLAKLAPDVLHITFAAADGRTLAPYAPGSHIIVSGDHFHNAYSLTGADLNPTEYEISVLRKPDGNGSVWLHENLSIGATVDIEGPRCLFPPVLNQRHALLVAGGIGVTPILSHARAIARSGGSADIIYSYRPASAVHLEELRELATRPGISLAEVNSVESTLAALTTEFATQPLGTHAYACGPIPMLESYQDIARSAGWPSARVHLERFTAPKLSPGDPFTVRVASTGEQIHVPSGVSLLERLLESGIEVKSLCRQGVCGECRIPIRSGVLDHRDYVLSENERAAANIMTCCVSRGTDIEVDL